MNNKKYEYIMNEREISEFCTKSFLEQFKTDKKTWIVLILVMLFLLLLSPRAAAALLIALALVYLMIFLQSHAAMKKALSGKQWAVGIEDDRLIVLRDGNYSEIFCKSMELIRVTRRLLMLGYMRPDKRAAWVIIPLRVFARAQESEEFLEEFRCSFTKAEKGAKAADIQEQDSLVFSYMVNEERWAHFQMEAVDMINGGTFGKTFNINSLVLGGVLAAVALWLNLSSGALKPLLVGYGMIIVLIILLRSRYRNPEKRLRKQAESSAVKSWECGLRRISLEEKGIVASVPRGKNFYQWESMEWLVETGEAFYIFHKDKMNFVAIAKESFKDLNQIEEMHRLCGQKGIKEESVKKRRHIPDWIFILALAAAFVLCMISVTIKAFRDSKKEMERVSGYLEYGMEQETKEQKSEGTENIKKSPEDRGGLENWVAVIESTGLHVSEETVESVWTAMTDYGLWEIVESDPYTWILMYMAAPVNQDEGVREYSKELFWFDFEGMDLTTDYQRILKGMLALSEGGSLDEVKDIQVNTDDVDWEKGSGTVEVSLSYKGEVYCFNMEAEYDWIDSKVLGILNSLLAAEEPEKLFYATWDGGQGVIVFFCTKEWKEQFEKKTGLELVCY